MWQSKNKRKGVAEGVAGVSLTPVCVRVCVWVTTFPSQTSASLSRLFLESDAMTSGAVSAETSAVLVTHWFP